MALPTTRSAERWIELFDGDRGSLLTVIVLATVAHFDLSRAKGRSPRGKKAPYLT